MPMIRWAIVLPSLLLLIGCHQIHPDANFALCENYGSDTINYNTITLKGGWTDAFGFEARSCSNSELYCISYPFRFASIRSLGLKPGKFMMKDFIVNIRSSGSNSEIEFNDLNRKILTIAYYNDIEGLYSYTVISDGIKNKYYNCRGKLFLEDIKL